MYNKPSLFGLLLIVIAFFFNTCKKDNFTGSFSKIGNPMGAECLLSKRVFSPDIYCDIIYDDGKKVVKILWSYENYTIIGYNEYNQIINFEEYGNEVLVKLTTLEWDKNNNTVVVMPKDVYGTSYVVSEKKIIEFDNYGQPVKKTFYRVDPEIEWKAVSYHIYKWQGENLIKTESYHINDNGDFEKYMEEEYEYDHMVNPKRFMTTVVFDNYMHSASRNNLILKKSRLIGLSYNIVDYAYEYNNQNYPVHAEFSETLLEGSVYSGSYFYISETALYNKVNWEYNCN